MAGEACPKRRQCVTSKFGERTCSRRVPLLPHVVVVAAAAAVAMNVRTEKFKFESKVVKVGTSVSADDEVELRAGGNIFVPQSEVRSNASGVTLNASKGISGVETTVEATGGSMGEIELRADAGDIDVALIQAARDRDGVLRTDAVQREPRRRLVEAPPRDHVRGRRDARLANERDAVDVVVGDPDLQRRRRTEAGGDRGGARAGAPALHGLDARARTLRAVADPAIVQPALLNRQSRAFPC